MPKFFSEKISGEKIIIDSEDVRHIKKVLRLKKGDPVTVCDGKGFDYETEICDICESEIICRIIDKNPAKTEPPVKVTIYQGIPKASKMDYIIQKNTELGISGIVPCALARCVSKIESGRDSEKKTARWQKIALEAAKQSGRGVVPEVETSCTLEEAIEKLKRQDLAFALYECEQERHLKKILTEKKEIKSVGFLIGPEGGLDPAEVQKLHDEGIPTIGLGSRILRTETAGEAVLAMIMYEIGDINI